MEKVEKKKAQRKDNKLKAENAMINLSEASVINLELNRINEKIKLLNLDWNKAIVDIETYSTLTEKIKQLNKILDYIIKKIG